MSEFITDVAPIEVHFDNVDLNEWQQLQNSEVDDNAALKSIAGSCLINLSERMDPPPIAMQIMRDGSPITLFTKGNFSIVTGAAKSRKSFLISMLMATAIKGSFHDQFLCNESGMNIIFDTEQAKYKVQQITRRICNLSETVNPSNLLVYSLRTLDPEQRIDLIDYILATTPNINFVAIDGIIDLDIDPILQADQAQRIVQKLMIWTEIYNIHIVCVLHYNKTAATLLGHLGSFSHRKADAIIEVSKNKEDENVSIVKPVDCREKEFSPFAFSIDPDGMPYLLTDYAIEGKTKDKAKDKKPPFTPSVLTAIQHRDILQTVFKTNREQGYDQCWRNIKNAVASIVGENIGDNKAKDVLAYYLSNDEIIKIDNPKKKAIYVIAGQSPLILE